MQSEYLNSKQAAQKLGVAEITVKTWRHRNAGPPYVRLGDTPQARVVYPVEELERWVAERTVYPGEARTEETVVR